MKKSGGKHLTVTSLVTAVSCLMLGQNAFAEIAEYTLDADFDQGTAINVVHSTPDELQLDDTTEPFGFIWIAVSGGKGTVVKIDTETGEVLGEYRTAPEGMGLNPSRTTVDKNGNVWVGNRNEAGTVPAGEASAGFPEYEQAMGSVVHIGLKENGGCVDRNGNGVIDTSTGLDVVLGWSGDTYGGVSGAEDECIIHYTRTHATGVRHLSVNSNNDVWVSGRGVKEDDYIGGGYFDLINGGSGNIMQAPEGPALGDDGKPYGGYGGLIDSDGVLWSALYPNRLLRWDTNLPLSGSNGGNWIGYDEHPSYGLCIDSQGYVWNTSFTGGLIRKFDPSGFLVGTYDQGSPKAQGCVVDKNDHVWVASSKSGGTTVNHLDNDGNLIGHVTVGSGPTGVAVDAAGKIWVTNMHDHTASRIDPTLNAGVGGVDKTTADLGGKLYNYSDMTGSTLTGAPDNGTWTVVHDGMTDDAGCMDNVVWNSVSWTADEPGDSSITVTVAGSLDDTCTDFGLEIPVNNDEALALSDSRCLKLSVSFTRSDTGESPILYDISVDKTASVSMDTAITGIILTRNWEETRDDAQFKMRKVSGIKDAAYAAVENGTPLTFQFGPCADPIYTLTVPIEDLNVTYLNMRYTVGKLDVVRCVFSSEQCVVNIENINLKILTNTAGEGLEDLLSGEMTVCLKVGGTNYVNTSDWTQYNSGSGSWTKYRN